MKEGSKVCPFCGTGYTFEHYQLIDSTPVPQPCQGCIRLLAILAKSAQLAEEAKPEPVGIGSIAEIEARLRRGARSQEPERDWAKAAAMDVD